MQLCFLWTLAPGFQVFLNRAFFYLIRGCLFKGAVAAVYNGVFMLYRRGSDTAVKQKGW